MRPQYTKLVTDFSEVLDGELKFTRIYSDEMS